MSTYYFESVIAALLYALTGEPDATHYKALNEFLASDFVGTLRLLETLPDNETRYLVPWSDILSDIGYYVDINVAIEIYAELSSCKVARLVAITYNADIEAYQVTTIASR